MSLDVVQAYVKGYSDRLVDQQILALQSGYWSAYYSSSKHPKPMSKIAETIVERHRKAEEKSKGSINKPAVDVEAFLETERNFLARLEQ